jgi:conjugal transfer pilus assembly protein TraD
MRGWDARVRIRVALLAAHVLTLAAACDGRVRWIAAAAAAVLAALVGRSFTLDRPPREEAWIETPARSGGLLAGLGAEWTPAAAEALLERGHVPWPAEAEWVLTDAQLDRHVLILGTTGAGKSRLLELLALQAVRRGDAVVVIDPKGDARLLDRVRRAAGERFRLLSLPHPERSVRYNPIGRFHDVREVADRIAALLPASGDALPFRNFAWEIVHTAASDLHRKGPVTLRALKKAAIDRPSGALASRPREYYQKQASALVPLLSKLSSELLSPVKEGLSWEEVDQKRQVAFLDLGALLGQESASAVAKMSLLDLQSHIGARYAFGKGGGPVWLFVDELGDVVTGAFVDLLAKSRGAGLRIVACAQSAADLEAGLGDRAGALRVIANAGTLVHFRAQSAADAELFSELAGERLLRARGEGATYEPALFSSGLRHADDFRARFGETTRWEKRPLVPSWALTGLPVGRFFARGDGRIFRGRVPALA